MGMFESKEGMLNGIARGRHILEFRVVAATLIRAVRLYQVGTLLDWGLPRGHGRQELVFDTPFLPCGDASDRIGIDGKAVVEDRALEEDPRSVVKEQAASLE